MIGKCSVCKALSVQLIEPEVRDDVTKRPVGTVQICLPCADRIATSDSKVCYAGRR